MENWLGAAEDARAGIQFQADWIEGYRLLCHALKGANQWQKALDACERVLLHVPHDIAFATLKAELELKCAEDLEAPGQEVAPDSVISHENAAENKSTCSDVEDEEEKSSHLDSKLEMLETTAETSGVSSTVTALKCELIDFARDGSIVAQRYLAAQQRMDHAREASVRGNLGLAIQGCCDALQLWPQMEIPTELHSVLVLLGLCSGTTWGSPLPYYLVQASKITDLKQNYMAEREFWRKAVDKHPVDPQLRMQLAWVLDSGEEVEGALEQTEMAQALVAGLNETLLSTSSWQYLRACCTSLEASASLVEEGDQTTREDRLLAYVEQSPLDDEWMPHALYTLGILSVAKSDYTRAKQFHFLAQELESRRLVFVAEVTFV